MTFKVGDKVRLVEQSTYTGIWVGDEGIIVKNEGKLLCVDVINKNGLKRRAGFYYEDKRWEVVNQIDKREQAIYKRLCNIKRPRPKVLEKGTKVKIRTDLVVDKEYDGHCEFKRRMQDHIGKTAILLYCDEDEKGKFYNINLDDKLDCWSKDMFEGKWR